MSESKTEQPNEYQIMESKDEEQILAEMKGEFLQNYVYSFKQGGRDINGLSYIGVKEAIRKRGHIEIVDQKIEETNGKIRALVKVHDYTNDIDVLGASEAEADKPFAYVLAVNKAERNAFAKLIPAKLFAELIAEKLHSTKAEAPKDVTPQAPTIDKEEKQATANTDVCPGCGARKDPKYDLCYTCFEAMKAAAK